MRVITVCAYRFLSRAAYELENEDDGKSWRCIWNELKVYIRRDDVVSRQHLSGAATI